MSQETKDFLIVAAILALGGWGFLTWQNNNPSQSSHSTPSQEMFDAVPQAEEQPRDKITCKIEPELKDFVKCDKETRDIQFFTDEKKEIIMFSIGAEELLSECENNQCKNVEIPSELKQITNDNPRTLSLIIPNYLTKEEIIDVIRKGFKKNPPSIGDDIQIHFLSYPGKSFVAEYAFQDVKVDIINYHRNKNKVLHFIHQEKEAIESIGFVVEEQMYFYSFLDFEEKLSEFLTEVPISPVTKDISFAQLLQNVGKVSVNEKTQVVVFVLDKTVQFPKAKSYALEDQGYSWFYTYQQRYNNDIRRNNRSCAQNGYQNCRLKEFWEESFAEYYVRHTEQKLFPILTYRFPSDKIKFMILDPSIDPTDKTSLEAEKEMIFDTIQGILKEKVTDL